MPYCNACGTEYALGDQRCSRCEAALPGTTVAGEVGVDRRPARGASWGRRVLAGLIDLVIAYALWYGLVLLLARRFPVVRGLLVQAWLLAVVVLPSPYLLLKDAIEGKSVGKLLMGLVVYNEHDRQAGGWFDSINRNWWLALPFVGSTLIVLVVGVNILAGRRKRLGDEWAQTVVLSDLEYQRT